jgi:dihydrofolate reductase
MHEISRDYRWPFICSPLNYSRQYTTAYRMEGGTEFRLVTEGIHATLEHATSAAGGRDVRLGGVVSTIRQYLRAALIDELHLAIRPVLLDSGEQICRDEFLLRL